MAYEFDVFLSYSRGEGDACTWVKEIFYRALRSCLANSMETKPELFVDWEMETGVYWPDELESALRRSKLMVSVLSPPYFRSPWCLAEWGSFKARQDQLGAPGSRPALLHPVVFADGEHFPSDATAVNYRDFSKWNAPMTYDGFRSVPVFPEFYRQVEEFAVTLAKRLAMVPDWNPDWPVCRPERPADPRALLPRL